MRRFKRTSRLTKPNRGIAMLLVLISLMTATVLTTAYVASRDNSATIGQNVASGVAARWAADSGLKIGEAILQTQSDWRSMGGGKLVDDYNLEGAKIDVDVIDLETNQPPTSSTQSIQMTSKAEIDGVTQTATATAFIPASPNTVDLDLSEFAAFAANSITMQNTSMITRWPMAPLAKTGARVPVGTRGTSASTVVMSDKAALIDGTVYAPPSASNSLISNAGSPAPVTVKLLDLIPFPAPPDSGETAPASSSASDLKMSGGTATITTNTVYKNAELTNNAARTLRGTVKMIVDQELRIETGAKLIIDGRVKIVVWGNLRIDQGAIELRPNARLLLFIRGSGGGQSLEVKDGYIGDFRANTLRDASGKASWVNPERILVFSAAPSGSASEWRIEGNSVVKGSLYAPHPSQLLIRENSALYGRVAAQSLLIRDTAAIFFDHGMDDRIGYTNQDSAVFTADGHIKGAIKTVSTLNPTELQSVADSLSLVLKSASDLLGLILPSGGSSPAAPAVGPTDPTPRPVKIDFQIASIGAEVRTWEK